MPLQVPRKRVARVALDVSATWQVPPMSAGVADASHAIITAWVAVGAWAHGLRGGDATHWHMGCIAILCMRRLVHGVHGEDETHGAWNAEQPHAWPRLAWSNVARSAWDAWAAWDTGRMWPQYTTLNCASLDMLLAQQKPVRGHALGGLSIMRSFIVCRLRA